jgi:hypothetical protein
LSSPCTSTPAALAPTTRLVGSSSRRATHERSARCATTRSSAIPENVSMPLSRSMNRRFAWPRIDHATLPPRERPIAAVEREQSVAVGVGFGKPRGGAPRAGRRYSGPGSLGSGRGDTSALLSGSQRQTLPTVTCVRHRSTPSILEALHRHERGRRRVRADRQRLRRLPLRCRELVPRRPQLRRVVAATPPRQTAAPATRAAPTPPAPSARVAQRHRDSSRDRRAARRYSAGAYPVGSRGVEALSWARPAARAGRHPPATLSRHAHATTGLRVSQASFFEAYPPRTRPASDGWRISVASIGRARLPPS